LGRTGEDVVALEHLGASLRPRRNFARFCNPLKIETFAEAGPGCSFWPPARPRSSARRCAEGVGNRRRPLQEPRAEALALDLRADQGRPGAARNSAPGAAEPQQAVTMPYHPTTATARGRCRPPGGSRSRLDPSTRARSPYSESRTKRTRYGPAYEAPAGVVVAWLPFEWRRQGSGVGSGRLTTPRSF
jgi:hypothetical protein